MCGENKVTNQLEMASESVANTLKESHLQGTDKGINDHVRVLYIHAIARSIKRRKNYVTGRAFSYMGWLITSTVRDTNVVTIPVHNDMQGRPCLSG